MVDERLVNRKNVQEFFDMTFNQHLPSLAAEKYLNLNYVHHGSGCDGSYKGFISYFMNYFKEYPDFQVKVRNTVAEEDRVVLLVDVQENRSAIPYSVAEFYRMENGKISEHWHVIQGRE